METLERSRVCRLCGKQAEMTIHIFGKREHHVKKINMVLPILVHEMDLLPKHMCHPCNYKLEEFHKFYVDCLKTDAHLKSQLSWMQGPEIRKETIVPMVQINNMKIKAEPLEYDEQSTITETAFMARESFASYESDRRYASLPSEKYARFSGARCTRCGCYCGRRNCATAATNDNNIPRFNYAQRKSHESTNRIVDEAYTFSDVTRRNLFATEIFENKNPTVRAEIPNTDVSKEVSNEQGIRDEVRSYAGLDRLGPPQRNVLESIPKIEAAADALPKPRIVSPRNLRPRKSIARTLPRKRIRGGVRGNVKDNGRNNDLRIKIEVPEESERSLRPRVETIDYSDSKRKYAAVRSYSRKEKRVKRRKLSLEDRVKREIVKEEVPDDATDHSAAIKLRSTAASLMLSCKVESMDSSAPVTYPMCTGETKRDIAATPFEIGNNDSQKVHIIIKDEILETKRDKVRSRKNMRSLTKGQGTREKVPKIPNGIGKRKNTPKKYHRSSTHCLRSQMANYPRNDKTKKFNFLADGPSSPMLRQRLPRLALAAFRETGRPLSASALRYQHCDMCDQRFASLELYKLHACYNNKRH